MTTVEVSTRGWLVLILGLLLLLGGAYLAGVAVSSRMTEPRLLPHERCAEALMPAGFGREVARALGPEIALRLVCVFSGEAVRFPSWSRVQLHRARSYAREHFDGSNEDVVVRAAVREFGVSGRAVRAFIRRELARTQP